MIYDNTIVDNWINLPHYGDSQRYMKTVIHTYQTETHITKNHRGVLHNEPLGNGPGIILLHKRYQTAKYKK